MQRNPHVLSAARLLMQLCALFATSLIHADEFCVYPSKRDGGSIVPDEQCAKIINDKIELSRSVLSDIEYDKDGLACIYMMQSGAFYLHQTGNSQKVMPFDNGCDYFVHGLARGYVQDKMVYFDKQLNIVLNSGFDYVEPFEYGHAVVCNGPFTKTKQEEHIILSGGQCGLMNRNGKLVVEARYPIGDRDAFDSYINSHNHCPPPPITDAKSAACHANRHIAEQEFYSADWLNYSVKAENDAWKVSFVQNQEKNASYTITLEAKTAKWTSLIRDEKPK